MSTRNQSFTRRTWGKWSLATLLGASASGWFPRLARAAQKAESPKSCILLWMSGGPSHIDTFDPKPDHENGGPVKAIATAAADVRISEYLPRLAKQMNDLAIIRNMTTVEGDHGRGSQLMMTGYRPNPATDYPGIGSLIAKELGTLHNELPNYISLSAVRRVGPGFLGPQYAPLVVSGASDDPAARANLTIENLAPPQGVSQQNMHGRFETLKFLQGEFAKRFQSPAADAHRANVERAARMIESQAKNAFRLNEEKSALRDAYGRNRFGQGCLLARRLVERGVPFVEVTLSGVGNGTLGWDTHGNNFNSVRELCGILDPAWSMLMSDLRDRGLLDSTMVIWMGEFGRTPVINGNNGRDHWASGWSTVLGGAGIRGGQAYGDTGKDGLKYQGQPRGGTMVPQLYATICEGLGIDHTHENFTDAERPIGIVDEGGEPIKELLS